MRKTILKVLATLLIVSLLLTNLSGYSKVKGINNESKIVNVSVDPRIELLYAVELLSNYPLLNHFDLQYKKEMLEHFSPFKSHPAVQKFKEMSDTDFSYDAPPTAMLYLSNPPELNNMIPFENNYNQLIERAGGKENLEAFVDALRDFAVKTNFIDFFNAHKEFYAKIVGEVETELGNYKDATILENFYGISQNSYNIILTPLSGDNGYGPRIEIEPSKFDIYVIIECGDIRNNISPSLSGLLKHVVWHEFSHSFVNPITEKFIDEVNKYSKLFVPISKVMRKQAYGEWEICVNEHIVRAVVAKLTEKFVSKEAAEEILSKEVRSGFVYIRGIYDIIGKYDKNRDKYPIFSDIYPEILDYFDKLSVNTSPISTEKTVFLRLITIFIFIAIGLLIFLKIRKRKKIKKENS